METSTKVLIGIGAAVVVGGVIYFGFLRKADEVVDATKVPTGGNGQPSPSGGSLKDKTKLEKLKAEAAYKLKDAKCNLKFPPPRFKQEKKDAYRNCLHSADAVMTAANNNW